MALNTLFTAITSLFVVMAALGLGGCTVDRDALSAQQKNSRFEETGGDQFKFTAVMNAQYPADDPKAEAIRQRWLNDDLVMSNRCSDGNASTVERKVIVKGHDQQTGASVGEIVYRGDCG